MFDGYALNMYILNDDVIMAEKIGFVFFFHRKIKFNCVYPHIFSFLAYIKTNGRLKGLSARTTSAGESPKLQMRNVFAQSQWSMI